MRQPAVRLAVAVWIVALALALPAVAEAEGPSVVRLEVEREAGLSRIWVVASGPDGRPRRTLLRETPDEVRPGASGGDPDGGAVFAAWSEGAGRPWSAYSLDGGASWVEPRPLNVELRLRDGAVAPGQPMPPVRAGLSLPPEGRVFAVQLHSVSLPAWRRALERAGAEVLAFVPHDGHLVRVDPGRLARVAALDFVRRVEPYHPSYRLEPALRDWLEDAGAGPERLRVRALAFEWGAAGKQRIADRALAAGAEIAAFWPSGHVLELWVDREQLRALAAHDDVMWIDRWTAPENDMDLVREDAGTNWLEAQTGNCGEGVRGEVLDSGNQDDHPDFDGIMFHGPHDVESHGTSTYGIVFGNGARDGDGNAQGTGHMPCAEQGIFADYETLGDRFVHTQELKNAPYFASFQTNSWGAARDLNYTSVSQEMDDIIWRLDIAITQSQSNAGNQQSRPQAWAKNIIAVGGIRHYNTATTADDAWAGGASIGPAADGRIKPDLNYWYDSIFTTTTGSGYTAGFGGTSAATPEVAGVLGLMLQMWADDVWGTDPEGTNVFEKQPHFSTIKALLINNAQQYPFTGTTHDLTRMHQGWGRPSVQIAMQRAANSFIIDEEVPLGVGEAVGYDVDVPEGETELKVTLVYPDPPGVSSFSLHRINDLDLEVTSPSAVVYHGNVGLDVGTESAPGGSPDGLNTVENVFVVSPEPGLWRVEIRAPEINQDAHLATPEDDAAFALVVTGGTGSLCPAPGAGFTITPNPARIGEVVQFDSTVGGGAGGPFTYRWDFDGDGVTDSIVEDPVFVYHRPYAGNAKLRIRDAENCPETVNETIDVTGPDLRFDGFSDLVEVEGNGNGTLDPGETWDLRVTLRNDGNETAVGTAARLAVGTGNPGTVSIARPSAAYPDIPAGGTGTSTQHYRVGIGHDFPCGQDAVFSISTISTTDPDNVYPGEPDVVRQLVGGSGPPLPFHFDGFEANLGWSSTGGGEWQFAAPQGLGGQSSVPGQIPKPDPTTPFEGSQVLGTDLTGVGLRAGNYENNVTTTITSPPISTLDAVDVEMNIARWLNTEVNDPTFIEITSDGVSWTRLFDDPGGFTEQSWTQLNYDVSDVADRQPNFRIRFGLTSDGGGVQGGWNVDALELVGVTKESCEPFTSAFPGAAGLLLVDKDAGGDLLLSWGQDCGGATTYGVYRGDLGAGYGSLGFEPGRCAVGGTSTTVPVGPGTADFFLVVPNDGATEGSYGADAAGNPRAPATAACLAQGTLSACAP